MRTTRQILGNRRGMLTLEELMIVLAVTTNLMSLIMPSITGFVQEAQLTKAEAELQTLKTAVASYWRSNNYTYPNNIDSDLTGASPQVISAVLQDPFKTDPLNLSYGYIKGRDNNFGEYFIIYTRGPRGHTTIPVWDAGSGSVKYSGAGHVVSNASVAKQ